MHPLVSTDLLDVLAFIWASSPVTLISLIALSILIVVVDELWNQ